MKPTFISHAAGDAPAPTRGQQAVAFAVCVLACFVTSALGALASVNAGSFYAELARPSWSPPGWLFGPVWSVLFLFMAIAAWLVWRAPQRPPAKRTAFGLFASQLVANALWSWLFFGWRLGAIAFVEVLVLWLLIACTLVSFWRISRPAGWLMLPYLLWVTFASVLNWSLWQLNPNLLG